MSLLHLTVGHKRKNSSAVNRAEIRSFVRRNEHWLLVRHQTVKVQDTTVWTKKQSKDYTSVIYCLILYYIDQCTYDV